MRPAVVIFLPIDLNATTRRSRPCQQEKAMPKFRLTYVVDAPHPNTAIWTVETNLSLDKHQAPRGVFTGFKISKVRGPKHMKGWRATHDARFVKPTSEFGGSSTHPYLSDAACISDSISPVFKRRVDAEWQIRSTMRLGPNHGWSSKRSDYSIHKV
jgi:hypothetical protein